MSSSPLDKRLQEMYRMLFEMATGTVSFRLVITSKWDALDKIAMLLNEVADLLTAAPFYKQWTAMPMNYPWLASYFITVNRTGAICSFSGNAPLLLEKTAAELLTCAMKEIIATESYKTWLAMLDQLKNKAVQPVTGRLVFRCGANRFLSVFCGVTRDYTSSNDVISFVSFSPAHQPQYVDFAELGVRLRTSEIATLFAIRDFILAQWDAPLPPVPTLARTFFIEEHKLKQGFQALFASSVYHFYTEQRLQQAHHLLQYSTLSLKNIGYQCGYESYYSFYRAFKKRFGYPPGSVVRLP